MLKSFIKVIFRNLSRNKVYAIISILGLALGISSSLLITLYIDDELSYDDYHFNKDNIYRLTSILDFNGDMNVALTSMATGPTLLKDYPEVESFVRFRSAGNNVQIKIEDKIFQENNVWFSDSTVLNIFSYHLLTGDKNNILKSPQSILLTEQLALKFYGSIDVVGNTLFFNNTSFKVDGVIANPPDNSEMQISALVSMNSLPDAFHQAFNQDWFRVGFYTYLLFNKDIDKEDFESKLVDYENRYVQPWSKSNGVEAGHTFSITPLSELHFDTQHDYDQPKGNFSYILIFAALALFLVIIASINFVNLTLAQGTKRAKEVGIRKTLGGVKNEIRTQHILESVFMAGISACIALILLNIALDPFNTISGKNIDLSKLLSLNVAIVTLILIILIGLIAGSYPAFVLSSFHPSKVLKGDISNPSSLGGLRKSLILVQFAFSIFMILATFLISDQMNYLENMDLGFNKENVLTLRIPSDSTIINKSESFITELKRNPDILEVCRSGMPSGSTGELMFRLEQNGEMVEKTVKTLFVDYEFTDVLGLKILEGRDFSREFSTDQQQAFLVNQEALKAFSWYDGALEKRVQWGLQPNGQAANDGKVIGVVNDFNFLSLHDPLEPIILCFNSFGSQNLSIRISQGDPKQTLKYIEDKWMEFAESYPFIPQFLSDQLALNYSSEKNMKQIFQFFSSISIFIACMGLFALLSYAIENRRKELGIRKVLGAGVLNLSWLIAKEFFVIMIVAFLIAAPVAFYSMQGWLQDFAYQSPIKIESFVISLLITLSLAFFTVLYHSFKIRNSDPINALRSE